MYKVIGWVCLIVGIPSTLYFGLQTFSLGGYDIYKLNLIFIDILSLLFSYGGYLFAKEKKYGLKILVTSLLLLVVCLFALHYSYDPKADFIW